MTHAETRKRTLVDKLYNQGLLISYDRVLYYRLTWETVFAHALNQKESFAQPRPHHERERAMG